MKTIYLHIGMPKTGTSALQMFFRANNTKLLSDGICYPNFTVRFPEVGANRNGHFLKYVQLRGNEPEPYMQCMKELKGLLWEHERILLSEESIWGKQTKNNWWKSMVKWSHELCVELKVIVYLRRQEDVIESMWNQKIKGFQKWTESFSDYIEKKDYDFLPLDYEKTLDAMAKYIGGENMIVRVYDPLTFKGGSIYEDFLDALGIESIAGYEVDENITNTSLPYDAVEIKRWVNKNASYASMKGVNFYDQVIRDAYADEGAKKETFLSREELEEIRLRFKDSNTSTAKKYLHREDGRLFSEKKELPVWQAREDILPDAVRIMAGADVYLYQRIEELETEISQLKEKMTKGYNNRFYRRIPRKIAEFIRGRGKELTALAVCLLCLAGFCGCGAKDSGSEPLITNVSYDPTRELYESYNELFKEHYKEETGNDIEVVQSHGGSGGQARSVVEGADADVVTLALEHDITMIEEAGLIEPGWISEFDRDSSPYTSTIVFLVRKGNEKGIADWDDLTGDGVEIIHPDPKSSGGACWNFLAAWHYADKKFGGDEGLIKDFLAKLYANVTVMDSGARGSTTTFVENSQGDVLVAWENEAINIMEEYPDEFEIISPSVSILAQPSVAVVDENADKNGTREAAEMYLSYLYSKEAQRLIGEMGYRPSDDEVKKEFSDKYDLSMELCSIEDFGGWNEAYEKYFKDGGIFDEIYGKE